MADTEMTPVSLCAVRKRHKKKHSTRDRKQKVYMIVSLCSIMGMFMY